MSDDYGDFPEDAAELDEVMRRALPIWLGDDYEMLRAVVEQSITDHDKFMLEDEELDDRILSADTSASIDRLHAKLFGADHD